MILTAFYENNFLFRVNTTKDALRFKINNEFFTIERFKKAYIETFHYSGD